MKKKNDIGETIMGLAFIIILGYGYWHFSVKTPEMTSEELAIYNQPKNVIGRMFRTIKDIDLKNDNWTISYTQQVLMKTEEVFPKIESNIRSFGRWASKEPETRFPPKELLLDIFANSTDQYGNTKKLPIITVSFKTSDLKKINWENAYSVDLLNFAKIITLKPIIKKATFNYCKTPEQVSSSFCQQASHHF